MTGLAPSKILPCLENPRPTRTTANSTTHNRRRFTETSPPLSTARPRCTSSAGIYITLDIIYSPFATAKTQKKNDSPVFALSSKPPRSDKSRPRMSCLCHTRCNLEKQVGVRSLISEPDQEAITHTWAKPNFCWMRPSCSCVTCEQNINGEVHAAGA